MKLIDRNFDVLNNSNQLETLQIIKNFPVFMGTVNHDNKQDLTAEMSWVISKKTGMIQLNKLIPLDILYKNSHESGVIGKLWDDHHSSFCRFIENYKHDQIIEIGGGNGILANKFHKNNPKVKWTIVDPNSKPIKGSKAKYINKFYNENLDIDYRNSTIVHSHTLEHVYEPLKFMDLISKNIKKNRLIFSVPNIKEMVKRKYTNAINFEHTYFLSEEFTKYFLEYFGFKIEKKEYFLEDHSIFYSATKCKESIKINLKNYYEENKKIFLDFKKHNEKIVKELNNIIDKKNSEIYLFGAHIFSQHLITIGLNTNKIKFILDNDKSKTGKRLYGTNLIVKNPKILKNINNPLIILKAGVYNSEIKKDILININSSAKFV